MTNMTPLEKQVFKKIRERKDYDCDADELIKATIKATLESIRL